MLIIALDDEKLILENTKDVIAQAVPGAQIMTFTRAAPCLQMIRDQGLAPDIVFCDIEMPGLTGLAFAARLKELSPDTRIVFVTAYPQYALDAFRVRAQGYILKPLQVKQVLEELAFLPAAEKKEQEKLRVVCFGNFDVFWDDKPVDFTRVKTKELFAYLVYREGTWCSSEEIIRDLWGDEKEDRKQYLRVLGSDLLASLRPIGMEKVLMRKRNQWAIDKNLIDCDYYHMLEGDMAALNTYRGHYMDQYSWAELTDEMLHFRMLR